MDDSDCMDSECSYDSDNSGSAMSSVQSEHGIAFAEEQSERLTVRAAFHNPRRAPIYNAASLKPRLRLS
jgi:hypothetical protein